MPELKRTEPGALLIPRPERWHFAAHPDPAAVAWSEPSPLPEPTSLDESASDLGELPLRPVPGPPPANELSRLEQLGLMTAGVAHDFNNVLAVIMVCAGEIAATGDAEQRERAHEISDAAERGAELSRRLLTEGCLPEPEAEPLAIDTAIVDALPLVKRTLGPGIEIALSSQDHLPHVLLAPGELQRMLVNLAANSRDAMTDGGAVAIRTAQVTIPPGDPLLGTGWYLRISFTDTGSGIGPELIGRAAQPYFTTKPGGGSGLGLATVRGLARSRGGEMRLSSPPGAGTTVTLDLPAVSADGEPLSLPAAGAPAPA